VSRPTACVGGGRYAWLLPKTGCACIVHAAKEYDEGTMARTTAESEAQPSATKGTVARRLVSLDAFRGATMALMVLVNTPGDGSHVYPWLEHSEWHGWTPTDVVFPSFLWIMGLAMTLSLGRAMEAGVSRATLLGRVLRRGAILYALGILVYAYPGFSFSTQRLLGVLQRIAICYVIAAAIYMTTRLRGQIVWIVGLLVGYWLMMTLIPVPGFGPGRLDVEGNLAHYVDRVVLGAHNYLFTKTWDPEGIVSTLPAIATTLLGIMAGHIIRLARPLAEKCAWLFVAGNLLIATGVVCNIWMPINKKLWTTSFSLFMAGLDFVVFAIFLWLIDGQGYKRAVKPLVVMGMNAIAVYLASEFLEEALDSIRWASGGRTITLHGWLFQTLFAPLASPVNASLLYAIAYTLLMFGMAYGMYRRGWLVRV
jgi:predicted acyltransferase